VPVWAWLGVLVIFSAAVRFDLARGIVAPWIMLDELTYSELAKSFAATGHFLVRGHRAGFGFGYPSLISPAYRAFAPVPDAYVAAKAINSVVMSLASVPAYFLARRVLSPWLSLAAATLTVAVPSMVYTGMLMTENAFYPLFLCAALALVLFLERPSLGRTLALVAVCGLAFGTRAQALALLPAILSAPLLLVSFDRREWRALGEYRHLYRIAGTGFALVLAFQLARGHSPLAVFGAYKALGESHYAARPVVRWFVYHIAELDLYVGVIPFAAFLVLAMHARELPRPKRAFVAAALPLTFWLLLEVAAFASRPDVGRIEERDTFYVAPLLLIALVVWIDERASPPVLFLGAAAACAAILPGLIPYSSLIKDAAVSDTLAFVPLWNLQDKLISPDHVRVLVLLASIATAAAFVLVPRRVALVLPALVLLYFSFEQWPIETGAHSVRRTSVLSRFAGITNPHRDWIDRAVGQHARVTVLWSGVSSDFAIWENEFFNRSVGPVYYLNGPPRLRMPAGGEAQAHLDPRSGLIRDDRGLPIRASYVLLDESMAVGGKLVAQDTGAPMALYRVGGLVRFRRAS
jgi:Dolichyl-phosphate-mannose-protein mannosyltransferase